MSTAVVANDSVHRSPPLVLVAIVFVALCVASLLTNLMAAGGALIPSAYPPLDVLQNFYTGAPGAVRLAAFFQFGASIPLAVLVASMVSRLQFHRVTVAGVHIALVGGTMAAVFMGVTALASWSLTHPGFDPAVLRVVHQFAIACDVGYAAGLGLLLAGIAIPSLAFGLLPRWVCLFGLAIAVAAELSVLTLILPFLAFLVGLVHIAFWIWLILASMMLPAVPVRPPSR
jgi:hypothetical protein